MSPFLISFLVSTGAAIWIYNKFQRHSGNNTQQSAKAAAVSGLAIFIVLYFIVNSILK